MLNNHHATQLGSIYFFCKAAELESFTSAAEALGVTPAAISRSVRRIEDRLGVRLFARTTRQIRLTASGQIYYEKCRAALTQIEAAESTLSINQESPIGLVKISVPTTYGHYRVLPLLPKFRKRYPKITVEINVSNRNIDFVEEGYDLAIRLGLQDDSRLVARKLEDATLGVFATPDYLKERGIPQNLEDLYQHECIQFILPSTGRAMPWIFNNNGINIDFSSDSQIRCSEDVLGCVTYALAGGGVFQIYHFIADEHIKKGELVEILVPFSGRSRVFSILYPQNRHQSTTVRAFVQFMVDESTLQGERGVGGHQRREDCQPIVF